jgi:hypothetical protein
VTALFAALLDDAALFPPGNASMPVAVPAHRVLRRDLGRYTGPFVVPAARLDELIAVGGATVPLSLIAAAADLPAALARGVDVVAVEVPPVADAASAAAAVAMLDDVLPATVSAALEIPRSAQRKAILDVVAGTRYRAKLRTGGLRADLFPTPVELAETIAACLERSVGFKCTAGLHHAVRHAEPATGFEHHGFLNVMSAVRALLDRATVADAMAVLDDHDPIRIAAGVSGWSEPTRQAVRDQFLSFGTCSVREPLNDLRNLGLLDLEQALLTDNAQPTS